MIKITLIILLTLLIQECLKNMKSICHTINVSWLRPY